MMLKEIVSVSGKRTHLGCKTLWLQHNNMTDWIMRPSYHIISCWFVWSWFVYYYWHILECSEIPSMKLQSCGAGYAQGKMVYILIYLPITLRTQSVLHISAPMCITQYCYMDLPSGQFSKVWQVMGLKSQSAVKKCQKKWINQRKRHRTSKVPQPAFNPMVWSLSVITSGLSHTHTH